MHQRYTLGFWCKAESKDALFETIAQKTFRSLELFNNLPSNYRPSYLTVKRLKDVKPFCFTYETFFNALQKGVSKVGKREFPDFGYHISLFSSIDESSCVSYRLHAGCSDQQFINTFIVSFPTSFPIHTSSCSKEIEMMFVKVMDYLNPFWAGAVNDAFTQETAGFPSGAERRITSVHWINYWGEEMLNQMDRKKLVIISKRFSQATFSNGFLQMQDLALDINNEKDVVYKREIERFILKK